MDAKFELIDLIHEAIRKLNDPRVKHLSFDCDNDSASLIIELEEQDFILSTSDVRELTE
jgi:hypothetical protein